ncbi:hypothetical protein HMPREF1210_01702 [Paenisporosarcina sp. HGH0030]|uniref:glycosyltransferase family A protein n=1 Tax=Paenisporosarcina sp. HGH0030 TaxID=1078085 RepID=UPI00034E317B|nr:glycosyltransferase family A protein [Paenisporosarcina sp. HGH0030]EPD52349.1 hypothetical protein HMPREF1210_01702 [Paenisporosarcina sp. HGH0030]
MKMQVLVSTMHQTDHTILDKINLQSNAIVVNQCNYNKIEEIEYNGNNVQFLSLNERGVGLSRNNALLRTNSEICLFADEDIKYKDSYVETILQSFKENPQADIILFNVLSENPDRPSFVISNIEEVKKYNCLKYGAVRIAAKTEKLKQANVYFSLLFGGGARYSSGEDSLFLFECIHKGLKVYTSPNIIGYVSQKESSWFEGFNDKYFSDKGVFYYFLSKKWSRLLCLQFAIRHRKLFKDDKNWKVAYELMIKGIKDFKGESK